MASTLNISKTESSNLTNIMQDVTIPVLATDGVTGQEETSYINSKATQYWGYFNALPDLKSAFLLKAVWNCGTGYTTDPETEARLNFITGWGKDTFNNILFNMEVMRRITGDAFAEIILDDNGELANLKVLDSASIKIVVDEKGFIKRYEQVNKLKDKVVTFKPEQIFHLCNNRLADQIHGISDIQAIEETIKADNESFVDMKKLMHWQARPLIMFKLGTDDQAKIQQFISKMDNALNKGENIYIPDDDNAVSYEVIQVNPNQAVFQWREDMRNRFYRTIGLPQIVPGAGGQSTESEGKVIYFAFEQIVKYDQLYLEEQIWQQLNFRIKLNPPASLMGNLLADQAKDAGQGLTDVPLQNG